MAEGYLWLCPRASPGFDGWVMVIGDEFDTEDQAVDAEKRKLLSIGAAKRRWLAERGVHVDQLDLNVEAGIIYSPPEPGDESQWALEHFATDRYIEYAASDAELLARLLQHQLCVHGLGALPSCDAAAWRDGGIDVVAKCASPSASSAATGQMSSPSLPQPLTGGLGSGDSAPDAHEPHWSARTASPSPAFIVTGAGASGSASPLTRLPTDDSSSKLTEAIPTSGENYGKPEAVLYSVRAEAPVANAEPAVAAAAAALQAHARGRAARCERRARMQTPTVQLEAVWPPKLQGQPFRLKLQVLQDARGTAAHDASQEVRRHSSRPSAATELRLPCVDDAQPRQRQPQTPTASCPPRSSSMSPSAMGKAPSCAGAAAAEQHQLTSVATMHAAVLLIQAASQRFLGSSRGGVQAADARDFNRSGRSSDHQLPVAAVQACSGAAGQSSSSCVDTHVRCSAKHQVLTSSVSESSRQRESPPPAPTAGRRSSYLSDRSRLSVSSETIVTATFSDAAFSQRTLNWFLRWRAERSMRYQVQPEERKPSATARNSSSGTPPGAATSGTRSWLRAAMASLRAPATYTVSVSCGHLAWVVAHPYRTFVEIDGRIRSSGALGGPELQLPELLSGGASVLRPEALRVPARLRALRSWVDRIMSLVDDAVPEPLTPLLCELLHLWEAPLLVIQAAVRGLAMRRRYAAVLHLASTAQAAGRGLLSRACARRLRCGLWQLQGWWIARHHCLFGSLSHCHAAPTGSGLCERDASSSEPLADRILSATLHEHLTALGTRFLIGKSLVWKQGKQRSRRRRLLVIAADRPSTSGARQLLSGSSVARGSHAAGASRTSCYEAGCDPTCPHRHYGKLIALWLAPAFFDDGHATTTNRASQAATSSDLHELSSPTTSRQYAIGRSTKAHKCAAKGLSGDRQQPSVKQSATKPTSGMEAAATSASSMLLRLCNWRSLLDSKVSIHSPGIGSEIARGKPICVELRCEAGAQGFKGLDCSKTWCFWLDEKLFHSTGLFTQQQCLRISHRNLRHSMLDVLSPEQGSQTSTQQTLGS